MYETFARVYDTFMDEVPYDIWAEHLIREMKKDGIKDGLVLDLGCGTGQMTRRLAQAGYDMIGVDRSADMLQIAQEKSGGLDILYLMQDMRAFELYGTVRAVISTCDSLNYVTDREDLVRVFRLVNNYLDPGGLFLFDLNSYGYYAFMCADSTFAESRDECSFIWENSFDPETRINEYDLTLFLLRKNGMYERFLETHRERAWKVDEVEMLLRQAGMRPEGARWAYRSGQDGAREDRQDLNTAPLTSEALMLSESEEWKLNNTKDMLPKQRTDALDMGTDRILIRAREHGKAVLAETTHQL